MELGMELGMVQVMEILTEPMMVRWMVQVMELGMVLLMELGMV